MKKLLLAAVTLIVACLLAYPIASAQEAVKPAAAPKHAVAKRLAPSDWEYSKVGVAARTKLCQADCKPNNYKACESWGCTGMHGLYRTYNQYDPELKSIEGRKQYAQCVAACVRPLPSIYVQRPILSSGGTWFGKSRQDCLQCHEAAQRN